MSPVRFETSYDAERARDGMAFFGTPLGEALERAEMEVLRQQVDQCFGARAILIGAGRDQRILDAMQVQRRFIARVADFDGPQRGPISRSPASVVDPSNLPFPNDSFDVVVLFHALDVTPVPQQALREAARVLVEGGQLIVTGFNPWSLWGLRRLFSRRRAPWNANFINPVRMADWLALLDFKVVTTEFARYRPPMSRGQALFDGPIAKRLKQLVKVPFGAVWIMRARQQSARAATTREPARERMRTQGLTASGATRARPRLARVDNVYFLTCGDGQDRERS